MSKLNSLVATHAMTIWMPIYEHSSDLRSEIITIKKFPFQLLVSIEDMYRKSIVELEPL
jgi:hypothetical protein